MEPDRWAEERRRGLTIDLGYAWLTLPSGSRLAFVDVPGHERFVPNMLAGVGPVPAVLFVVAADEGWMPQSEEHLAAIDALGISRGLLVVSRADLADPTPALRTAAERISRSSLGPAPALAVSAVTGAGLPALIAALERLVSGLPASDPAAPVRLWIDRGFSMKGSGAVVTGTLPAGTVRVGDELRLTPSLRPVVVRGIQALKETVRDIAAVARVALNLRGVHAGSLARGMTLVTPGAWTMTSVVDVRVGPAAKAPGARPPDVPGPPPQSGAAGASGRLELPGTVEASGQPALPGPPRELTVHVGAARTTARVRMLQPAIARLTLPEPFPLHVGDRMLLRVPGAAPAAGRSVAPRCWPPLIGATVLDVAPPALAGRGAGAAAGRELSSWPAVPRADDLLRRHHLLRLPALRAMGVTGVPAAVTGEWAADPAYWAVLRDQLARIVAAHAARDPLAAGMPVDAARAALGVPNRRLVEALAGGAVTIANGLLRVGHLPPARVGQSGSATPAGPAAPGPPGPATSAAPAAPGRPGVATSRPPAAPGPPGPGALAVPAPAAKLTPAVPQTPANPPAPQATAAPEGQAAPTAPPTPVVPEPVLVAVRALHRDLARTPFLAPEVGRLRELGLEPKVIAAAGRAGLLLRISDQIVLAPGADTKAAEVLATLPQPFTTAQARQALGTTRRVAIPLLEYLDRAGVTQRLPDDRRQLRRRPAQP
jgi:selenocysteine-specific elongation factor